MNSFMWEIFKILYWGITLSPVRSDLTTPPLFMNILTFIKWVRNPLPQW